ncbi:hypothetical protein [uncultured Bartonella sp.]|nr:hypothetical protein [uncultured Bartonella sp.]
MKRAFERLRAGKKPAGFDDHLKGRLGWPFERAVLLAADGAALLAGLAG